MCAELEQNRGTPPKKINWIESYIHTEFQSAQIFGSSYEPTKLVSQIKITLDRRWSAESRFNFQTANRWVEGVVKPGHVHDITHFDHFKPVITEMFSQDVSHRIFGQVPNVLDVTQTFKVLVSWRNRRDWASRRRSHGGIRNSKQMSASFPRRMKVTYSWMIMSLKWARYYITGW